jgi:hypothetical protein
VWLTPRELAALVNLPSRETVRRTSRSSAALGDAGNCELTSA